MIHVKKTIVLLIILTVFSGCTTVEDEKGGEKKFETADRTTDFNEITYSVKEISPGRKVRIRAVVQNNNVLPAENVELRLSDTTPLVLEEETDFMNENSQEKTCSFEELAPATENYGGDTQSCSWTLECPDNSQCSSVAENYESFDIPLKIQLSYETELTNTENAISVDFLELEDLTGSTSTNNYVAENGDLRLETEYTSPKPIDKKKMDLDMKLTNQGKGNLGSDGISIEYTGPFTTYIEDTKKCSSLIIPEGSKSVDLSCSMPLKDLEAGNTYQLRMRGRYKYSKTENIQLKITS